MSFWQTWALGASTNQFPLVSEKNPMESGWIRRLKKRPRTGISRGNAHDELCDSKFAPSRHALWFTYISCVWLRLFVDHWLLKEVWYAPAFLSNCSTRMPNAAPGITKSPRKRICRGTLSQKPRNWPIWQAVDGFVAGEGPSQCTILLWKAGLHVQSEDQRVFVCAEPSLFRNHRLVVFLGSEIGEIDAASAILHGSWKIVCADRAVRAAKRKQRQATGTGTRTWKIIFQMLQRVNT